MQKACFTNGCTREAASSCNCGGNTTYSCKKHLMKHISSPNEHLIISLLVSLPKLQGLECMLKVSKALKHLKATKEVFITQSNKIINHVNENTRKLLKLIRDTEKDLQDFVRKAYTRKKVNREQYESIQKLFIPQTMLDSSRFETIIKSLTNIYDFKVLEEHDLALECDLLISPRDQGSGGLFSIDLSTFKSMPLTYAPIIGGGALATKISKDSFFFYGGCKSESNGDIFILNAGEKNYQSYGSSTSRAWGAALHRAGKVYIFGGYEKTFISTCKTF